MATAPCDRTDFGNASANQAVNRSGYIFADSTVKLLERFLVIRARTRWSAARIPLAFGGLVLGIPHRETANGMGIQDDSAERPRHELQ